MKTKPQRVILIILMTLIITGGAYLFDRYNSVSHRIPASDMLNVNLSEQSKPEQGLYLIDVKNLGRDMLYVVPNLRLDLQDGADGFQQSYLSAPHGQFTGYEILPYTKITLQVRVSSGEGFLEYQQAGQIVYPSSRDTPYISIDLRVSELEGGTCQQLSLNLPMKITPLQNFIDDELLQLKKSEQSKSSGIPSDLPPLDDLLNE